MLSKLHKLVFGQTYDYGLIDINPYMNDTLQLFNQNPVFSKLSETYSLQDLSLNTDQITSDDIKMKYIYIYIFLDLLYFKVRNDVKAKEDLYNRINFIGDNNNFFGYIKLYTVYYSTKIVKWFNNSFMLRLLSSTFLIWNILEAVIEDLTKFQFINAFVGFCIALITPFNVSNFRKDTHDNIICDFTDKWINMYTSWNSRFTYSDSPGKNYFPRTSICLLNSYKNKSEWLNNRAYVLFASHILKSFKEFNDDFSYADLPNPKLLDDWNMLNLKYLFGLL